MADEIKCLTCGDSGDVHTIDGQWRGECAACDAAEILRMRAKIEQQAAEIEHQRRTLEVVERWANHHARKPSVTPAEALSVIQHHSHIREITAGYVDGVVPDTFDPYAEIERLRAALVGLVGSDDKAELDDIRATLMLAVSDDDSDKAALLAAIDALKGTAR